MNNSRYIPKNEERRLYLISGNRCAKCKAKLYIENSWIGEIAHIEAVNPGGARFNPERSSDFLNSYDNLILLCCNCHKDIDTNTSYYTVDILKKIKYKAEMHIEDCLKNSTFSEIDKKFISEMIVPLSEIKIELNHFNVNGLFLNSIGEHIDELLKKIELNQYMLSQNLIRMLLCIYADLDELTKLLAVNSYPYTLNSQYNYIPDTNLKAKDSIDYLRIKSVKDIVALLISKI